jgi:sulfur carrier protein
LAPSGDRPLSAEAPPASTAPLKLTVNGEAMEPAGVRTIGDLLKALELERRSRVAVAVNLQVVPRADHDRHELRDGDRIEIIHAVGGG